MKARKYAAPIVTLLLLAPIVSEVLYGATRLSTIFVLIPEILTWGCGALLIREVTRAWRKGWPSMLLLGLALAVAEEWIIQQTSIAPLVGLAQQAYGRVWGVNWVYLVWALGYESVWVVLVPVQLTELLFPASRDERWLRTRGTIVATIAFLFGACIAWYGWTQQARVAIFHMPAYTPSPLFLLIAAVAIAALTLTARAMPTSAPRDRSVPSPWIVGLTATFLGSPWAAYALLGYGSFPSIPFPAALVVALIWAALTLALVYRWTSSAPWSDAHRLALAAGGVLACMTGGFAVFALGGASRFDWIGKIVLNVVAAGGLIWLWRSVRLHFE